MDEAKSLYMNVTSKIRLLQPVVGYSGTDLVYGRFIKQDKDTDLFVIFDAIDKVEYHCHMMKELSETDLAQYIALYAEIDIETNYFENEE